MTTVKKTAPLPIDDPRALREAVKVERYAELLAHVLHYRGDDLFEVISRLGLTPEEWYAIDAAWTGELSLGMKRMQRDQALRFSAALATTRKRLLRLKTPLASIGEAVAAPPPQAVAAPPVAPPPQPLYTPLPPTDEKPSPWAAARLPSAVQASPTPHLPPVASPPAQPAPPLQAVPLATSKTPLGATADISAFVPRQHLPFASASSAAPPAAASPAPVSPSPRPATGTVEDISPFVPRPSLPFPGPPGAAEGERVSVLPEAAPRATNPDSPPPGKMLIRFNPNTGEPLPTPIWVDIPPKPTDT